MQTCEFQAGRNITRCYKTFKCRNMPLAIGQIDALAEKLPAGSRLDFKAVYAKSESYVEDRQCVLEATGGTKLVSPDLSMRISSIGSIVRIAAIADINAGPVKGSFQIQANEPESPRRLKPPIWTEIVLTSDSEPILSLLEDCLELLSKDGMPTTK